MKINKYTLSTVGMQNVFLNLRAASTMLIRVLTELLDKVFCRLTLKQRAVSRMFIYNIKRLKRAHGEVFPKLAGHET